MKRFMLLHFGFEKPTPEIMEAWGKWFESIADRQVAQGGFAGGREISTEGTRELSWGMDSITGYEIREHQVRPKRPSMMTGRDPWIGRA